MPKRPTTIRLDKQLYKQTAQKAEKAGLTFSGVVHMLLQAFNEGSVEIGVTQHHYPPKYLKALEKESAELSRLYKAGKVKSYSSAQEMFDDILGE